jgi:hypothetical protein
MSVGADGLCQYLYSHCLLIHFLAASLLCLPYGKGKLSPVLTSHFPQPVLLTTCLTSW